MCGSSWTWRFHLGWNRQRVEHCCSDLVSPLARVRSCRFVGPLAGRQSDTLADHCSTLENSKRSGRSSRVVLGSSSLIVPRAAPRVETERGEARLIARSYISGDSASIAPAPLPGHPVAYVGPDRFAGRIDREEGEWCYRTRAHGPGGSSDWSSTICTIVAEPTIHMEKLFLPLVQ